MRSLRYKAVQSSLGFHLSSSDASGKSTLHPFYWSRDYRDEETDQDAVMRFERKSVDA